MNTQIQRYIGVVREWRKKDSFFLFFGLPPVKDRSNFFIKIKNQQAKSILDGKDVITPIYTEEKVILDQLIGIKLILLH